MKDDVLRINLIASIVAVFAMLFLPFTSWDELTLFEIIGRYGEIPKSIGLSLLSLFLSIINIILGAYGLVDRTNHVKAVVIITSIIALVCFLTIEPFYEGAPSGVTVSVISLIIMAITSFFIREFEVDIRYEESENSTKDNEIEVIAKADLFNYSDAAKLRTEEIENMLRDESINDLNPDYIKTLKFILAERAEEQAHYKEKESAYNNAILLSDAQRVERINSARLYTPLSISAISYIDRSIKCGLQPTLSGFMETFKEGYIAPETPAERIERERKTQELHDLDSAKRIKHKKQFWVILSSMMVMGFALGIYFIAIQPNIEYKKAVEEVDRQYANLDKTTSLENQESELRKIIQLYCDIEIPPIGEDKKSEQISFKVSSTRVQLEMIIAEQNNLKEEARMNAEMARRAAVIRKAEADRIAKEQAEYDRLNPTDAVAQMKLGYAYEKGDGVAQSYDEAVKWYRKAADQGNATAQYNLGVCYSNGHGVDKNYLEAAKWYRKAADKGNSSAQNNLGNFYKRGVGVTQSYSEAVTLYRKAANKGNAHAQKNLGDLYRDGLGVTKNYSEAVKLYRKAAEQGLASAQNSLGDCYKNGQTLNVKRDEAIKWYRKAAEQGVKAAQNSLKELGEE